MHDSKKNSSSEVEADFVFVRSPKIKSWITNAGKFNVVFTVRGEDRHIFFSGNGATVWSLIDGVRTVRDIKRKLKIRMSPKDLETFLSYLWENNLTRLVN